MKEFVFTMHNKRSGAGIVFLLTFLLFAFITRAQTVTNGSVTGAPVANSGISNGNAPPWSSCWFSPDLCDVTFRSYTGNSQVAASPSPDGGTWAGIAGNGECTQTSITGLTIGNSYTLYFCGSNFGTASSYNGSPATPQVTVGASTQVYAIAQVANIWNSYSLNFTATAAVMTLEIRHTANAYANLDGFTLAGPCGMPLAVELLHFDATAQDDNTVLATWQTASETDNDYFTVERSSDGEHFKQIGRVQGKGNSNSILDYSFVDSDPIAGVSYYRLKPTDINGADTYSDMVSVTVNKKFEVKMYPNPSSGIITIETQLLGTIEVYDLLGETLLFREEIFSGKSIVNLDILSKGIYLARFINADETSVSKLIIL